MSIIKSFSVTDTNGEPGDMFYIQHGTNNFTIIDCCLNYDTQDVIVDEILENKRVRHIESYIKEHPEAMWFTSGANKIIYKDKGV